MKRVTFLRPAEEEMTEAAAFYATRAEHLGSLFLFRIAVAVRQIQTNPKACPVIRADIRRKLVAQFPYGVLYRDDPDEIVVIAVMHLHRRPDYWTHRT